MATIYEKIQALGPRPAKDPNAPTQVTVDPNDMKLPNQRSTNMPAYLYELLQNQKAPNVYKAPTMDYGNAQTALSVQSAQAQTSSPAAIQKTQEVAAQAAEVKRPRGRAATLLTGSQGLLSEPNISRRSLLGF